MALLAPATACGLSRPVTPPIIDLGCGNILVRREEASELAGLGVVSGEPSAIFRGCSEARRFARVDIEDWLARRGLGGCLVSGCLGSVCCEEALADAILSRKERRDAVDLGGVSSGIGDAEAPRLRGLRRGSLEEFGVSDGVKRLGVGDLLA
jgi:hypothetical protein